ncbi:hypothetical protein GCM10010330_57830 [Streptomyces tendae]|nr:hypothetical protein GCM10010330_57830 [Streptomyces tendae]
MPAEDINTRAWQIYRRRQLARAYAPPVPERLSWPPWTGPDREQKSSATSPTAASWTSTPGPASTPVRLAQPHGARVTGIEHAPRPVQVAAGARRRLRHQPLNNPYHGQQLTQPNEMNSCSMGKRHRPG